MTTASKRHTRILGTGSYLPANRVTNAALAERLREVLLGSRPPRCHQGNPALRAHRFQLLNVVTGLRSIRGHAIEDDFARAESLRVANPLESRPVQRSGLGGISRVLTHAPDTVRVLQGVDPDDDALNAERLGQLGHERRALERSARGNGPVGALAPVAPAGGGVLAGRLTLQAVGDCHIIV